MEEGVLYFALSFTSLALAITSALCAWFAIRRGLTYLVVASTVWTLTILGIARVWHTIVEFYHLEKQYGEGVEMIEYILIIIAYAVFVWAVARSLRIKTK